MHKSALIGMFLAVLELVRHHSVEAEQDDADGEIWVRPGPNFRADFDIRLLDADGYDGNPPSPSPADKGPPEKDSDPSSTSPTP